MADPDYGKPSQTGPRPPAAPGEDRYRVTAHSEPAPSPLPCTKDYTVMATAEQVVAACAGVAYFPLYQAAAGLCDTLLDRVQCPSDNSCRRFVLELYREWNCGQGGGPPAGSWAHVTVVKRVFCVEAEPAGGLPVADATTFAAGPGAQGPAGATGSAQDGTTFAVGTSPTMACGDVRTFDLTWTEPAPCPNVTDFKPYVDHAQSRAQDIARQIPCAQPCSQKIEYLWWDWSCAGKDAQVLLLYRVTCVQPPPAAGGTGMGKPGCLMAPALWLGRLLSRPVAQPAG